MKAVWLSLSLRQDVGSVVGITAEEPAQVLYDLVVGAGVPSTAVLQQHCQPLACQTLYTNNTVSQSVSLLTQLRHLQRCKNI